MLPGVDFLWRRGLLMSISFLMIFRQTPTRGYKPSISWVALCDHLGVGVYIFSIESLLCVGHVFSTKGSCLLAYFSEHFPVILQVQNLHSKLIMYHYRLRQDLLRSISVLMIFPSRELCKPPQGGYKQVVLFWVATCGMWVGGVILCSLIHYCVSCHILLSHSAWSTNHHARKLQCWE